MSQTTLPTVTEVNAAKGDDLRALYKRVFGEKTASKDAGALRKKIIDQLKSVAKGPANGAQKPTGKTADSTAYDQNTRAAEEAEKKGEWLTAALAWESAAKLTVGKGKEMCLERAAKARVNAKAPAAKPDAAARSKEAEEKKAARAKEAEEKKAAREKEAQEKKAAREKEAQEKKEAREKAAKEKEEAKIKREKERADAKAKKEADKLAAKEAAFEHDARVAHLVGKTIVHEPKAGNFANQRFEIEVVKDGFMYKGEKYKSLSAIGKLLTGKATNGFVFFGITPAPRPELQDEEGITAAYAAAKKGLGDLPPSLDKVLSGTTEDAHAAHVAIGAAADELAARAKALRTAARLIEAKKGRAA